MLIRSEQDTDDNDIRRIHEQAFGRGDEAQLYTRLRTSGTPLLSLVAVENGRMVGHILFSPASLESGGPGPRIAALAPFAVLPELQRRGIGRRLITSGLSRCRGAGYGAVVVLGYPEYYTQFGFEPASRFGLHCEYVEPGNDAFMALELSPAALADCGALVRFHEAFAGSRRE